MDSLELLKLFLPLIGILCTGIGGWITVKICMARTEEKLVAVTDRVDLLENELGRHGDWHEKLVDALTGIQVICGRMDERLNYLQDEVKQLRKGA